jgi:hypothetical protein
MQSRKNLGFVCVCLLVLSAALTACSGGGNSTATPGTGAEHTLPSQPAGYPAGGVNPTPEAGYPQP